MRVPIALLLWALLLPAQSRRPNIILVSLDQCLADRLHVYGNPRPTSPNLDRMAAEGVRFERFYSAAPWTAPSYGAMMTSQYPSRHGVTLFFPRGVPGLKPGATTLAELFRKAGYKTGAFVNNSVAGAYLTAPGFDDYDEGQRRTPPPSITERGGMANPDWKAPATNPRIFKWLDINGSKPFFLFVLYFEPHSPYDPPPDHDLFKSDAYPQETNTGYDLTRGHLFRLANLADRRAIERLEQLYDGKIHFIDHYFGQVLERLRASGLDKNTIVLLTSDHGELLYSHPDDYMTFDHRSLYDTAMHVPAIFWGGGLPPGKTVGVLATHIDIAPTLLEFAGLPPKADAQGVSLAPLVRGSAKKAVHPYLFGEQNILEPLRSVRDVRYKLILNERSGRKQLFDTKADPAEKRDLASTQPRIVARLERVFEDWRKANEPAPEERERRWREILAKGPGVQTVDEVTTGAHCQLTGQGWNLSDNEKDFGGGLYWTEPASQAGQRRTAMWRTDNPLLGRFRVSVWYGVLPERGVATDAPFTVKTKSGEQTFHVDQNANSGRWQELGIFEDPVEVRLTNEANGRILVDAVRFERLN